MKKWKLKCLSVFLIAVFMISSVPGGSGVYAADNGELRQYDFYWGEYSDSRDFYFISEYAYDLGNGWFFGFNLGTLLSDKYLEQGLVDYIRQAVETKTIPDELLEQRGSYSSAVGMYDPDKVPPVFWYRGSLVEISSDRSVLSSAYTMPEGEYSIEYQDYINGELLNQKMQLYGNELYRKGVRYSNAEDVTTYNGTPIYNYSYEEYVAAFGKEPPLPPGWEYEKEDKKELAALLKDIGINYYPYSNSLTEDTWKPLETAFYAGIDVYNNAKATREEIVEAVYDIKYYRALLQLKPGEKSLSQQRRERALQDFWDMLSKAIENFGKVKDAAEYVPDDRVKDWVGKVNKVTDKVNTSEKVVKSGYDVYEWFNALFGASKTQTSGEVNEGTYEIIRKTGEIVMTPYGDDAREFVGEGGVTVAKGISGKAHTNKVADGYIQAGQYDEAIQSMVPSALRQKGGQ